MFIAKYTQKKLRGYILRLVMDSERSEVHFKIVSPYTHSEHPLKQKEMFMLTISS